KFGNRRRVPEITPEKVVLVLSFPVVSVADPSVTLPTPASDPIVWLNPLRSTVAAAATVKALFDEKAFVAPACSVPTLTLVAPVYVLAPLSVALPASLFVGPPTPPIVPPSVALLPLVSNVPPPALRVVPRFKPKPARNWSVPPPNASPLLAAPKLASVVTASVPALIAVPPVYVLTPLSVNVPAPLLVTPPMPPIVPPSVALLPLVSKAPPPALSVAPRFEVKPARNWSVPPPKVSPLEAAPKLASVVTASRPALIVVPPVYVLTPLSVSVPPPVLISPPVPDMIPENVVLVLSPPAVSAAAPSVDPPPLKWSDLRYVFDIQEDCNGKEAIQT